MRIADPRPDGYVAHLLELLQPLGPVGTARFFGGVALKLHDRQFGMVMQGRLYFVVDDRTRPRYEGAGAEPFSYATKKGRVDVPRYFEVPGGVHDDDALFRAWASDAVAAAGSRCPATPHPRARRW